MPLGRELPPLQPDAAVAKDPEWGLGDEKNVDDDSPSSYSERWVLGSGTPGSYGREESVGLSGSLPSLSPFKKVGSRFGSAGVFGLVAQGLLGL
jgi:hypothetical protein